MLSNIDLRGENRRIIMLVYNNSHETMKQILWMQLFKRYLKVTLFLRLSIMITAVELDYCSFSFTNIIEKLI